jgi:hypothetical protein
MSPPKYFKHDDDFVVPTKQQLTKHAQLRKHQRGASDKDSKRVDVISSDGTVITRYRKPDKFVHLVTRRIDPDLAPLLIGRGGKTVKKYMDGFKVHVDDGDITVMGFPNTNIHRLNKRIDDWIELSVKKKEVLTM